MPELPEVENVKRSLEALVTGKTIRDVDVRLGRIVRKPDDAMLFSSLLEGCVINGVSRRGKYLLFDVPPYTLVSHLRMEGQYRLCESNEPLVPHTHVIFHFDDGTELRYRDVRQFGTMDLVRDESEFPSGLAELGPEPFDEALTPDGFYARLHKRTAPIKAVLLDQTVIAGLGNIYVDEALHMSGIHPERAASTLNKKQISLLLDKIREILLRAIEAGGSSIKTYVNGYGRHGGFQMELAVYGREGETCRTCGTVIEKSRVAGRGTHVCPKCQPKPRRRDIKPEISK